MKKIQQKVKSCTHSLEFLSTPLYYQFYQVIFFLAGLFLRAFLFLVYYENYSKLHEIVCTVKIFQNLILLRFCIEKKEILNILLF